MNKRILCVMACFAGLVGLSGCGGGGGDDDGGGTNMSPAASFTATPDTGELPLTVDFDGSGSSDSDGSIASYAWDFGDSSAGGTGATTSHEYTAAGTYTVRLTVTDNDGATANSTGTVTVAAGPPPANVTLSGTVTYERVPFVTGGSGLDFSGTFAAPARGVVVQLLRADQSVVASTITGTTGQYQFNAPASTDVRVRVRAQLQRVSGGTGQPGWDVQIRNNTNSNALYVLDGSLQNTGVANQTRNLNADSGWPGFGGTSYSGTRAAAPFAIADTLYDAINRIVSDAEPGQVFEPLSVYWSVGNRPAAGDDDYSDGEIGTTFYRSGGASPPGIYVLGDDGVDTDEFDSHVLAHEFMHYVEFTIGRSDSIGGIHGDGDLLDLRVAFSEGFANAFSGIALSDPVYRDSFGASQGDDFGFDLEGNTWTNPGWFSEGSIGSIVWDLYDSADDGFDSTSVPFSAIYDVQRTELRDGPALTSLFVFISGLKTRAGLDLGAIDAIVAAQMIVASTIDAYGTTETHDGGVAEALPVYTEIPIDGSVRQVCGVAEEGFFYNTLGSRRFLAFTMPAQAAVEIRVVSSGFATADYPAPDPDLALYHNGFFDFSDCGAPDGVTCTEPQNTELYQGTLPAGDYVLEVYEYSHIDDSQGVRPSTCMDVTITG